MFELLVSDGMDWPRLAGFYLFNLLWRKWRLDLGEDLDPKHHHFRVNPGNHLGLLANNVLIKFLVETGDEQFLARHAEFGLEFCKPSALGV